MEVDLSKYIPNVLTAAPGETDLRDKLDSFIVSAGLWFDRWFCPVSLADPDSDETGSLSPVAELYFKILYTEAYRLAIPQLDLVLTANGFATVDSKNVVPASKARTDRLLEGLLEDRDRNICLLVFRLQNMPEWLETVQAEFFRTTLFVNPEDVELLPAGDALGSKDKGLWEFYRNAVPAIREVEDSLAEEWFSPELMDALRKEKLERKLSGLRKVIAERIAGQVTEFFTSGNFKARKLAGIVNIIKMNPEVFPEWVNSDTAEIFFPPKFHNKKDSAGYFF